MLPKKLQDIYNKKDAYIQAHRDIFENDIIDLQKELLNRIMKEIIPELDIEDGIIQHTKKNLNIIHELDKLYEQFAQTSQRSTVENFANTFSNVDKLIIQYFKGVLLDTATQKRFDQVISKTTSFMHSRIGVNANGELVKGGYLESFIEDRALLNELRQLTMRAVTGGLEGKSFVKEISDKIVGNEDISGGFEKYYRTYAYDSLQEYDRAYCKSLADEFKMNYALYQGGLIEDSREFCIEHNDKVYSREEISKFGEWKDPETKEVPSYIAKFPGYDPFVHCGGFQCRHSLSWIGDQMAFRLRPELKK